ncbi:hypothetical protein [Actinomadura sp. J1-007]|uniref:hypothetical protein n=1 Tax=Actinomadura sp. J1-007 TaxID=2661913 RepID=UPI00136E843E|nr:hypothetical protein [Actinomadura sp. J1-007]
MIDKTVRALKPAALDDVERGRVGPEHDERIAAIMASDRRARRRFALPSAGVRVAAVAGLAASIAVGATVLENLGGTDENGRRRSVLPGFPTGAAADAAQVLDRAARVAEARPAGTPREDQWTYLEERSTSTSRNAGARAAGDPLVTSTVVTWQRVDGSRWAVKDGEGRIAFQDPRGITPRTDYDAVAALPADPARLLAAARAQSAKAPVAGAGGGPATLSYLNTILRDSVPRRRSRPPSSGR